MYGITIFINALRVESETLYGLCKKSAARLQSKPGDAFTVCQQVKNTKTVYYKHRIIVMTNLRKSAGLSFLFFNPDRKCHSYPLNCQQERGDIMEIADRRKSLMRVLCRRRHDTVANLAREFGVSVRTILRDIEALSITEPIYTQCGRHGGGVYVLKNYSMDQMYMSKVELEVLQKLFDAAAKNTVCPLNETEKRVLKNIIQQYSKPILRKENHHEKNRKKLV